MAAKRLDDLVPPGVTPAPADARDALSLVRAAHLPRPDLALWLGDTARNACARHTVAFWDIMETICMAASELGEKEITATTFKQIFARFPRSPRTFSLLGIRREALSRWDDAMGTYIQLIADHPMCAQAYKRQVAVLKSQRKGLEAVALLSHYLSLFSTDLDAWAELCALELEQGKLSHALFAANELVIQDPANHAAHTLVADVYMTCGSEEDVLMARTHYSASVSAKKIGNLRALYGMWLSASVLKTGGSLKDKTAAAKNEQVLVWARAAITAVYAGRPAANGSSSNNASYKFIGKIIARDLAPSTRKT